MRLGNGWVRKSRAYILPGKQPTEGRGSARSREVTEALNIKHFTNGRL